MSVTIVDRSVDDLENGTNERRALVDGETGGAKPPV